MAQSRIEWTECTWNPVTGCSKVSPGCANCYAERMSKRLQAMGQPNYRNGFRVTCHPHALDLPLRWRKPQMVFVNSMSDLFHKEVPDDFILQTFEIMRRTPWHTFQVLTKRAARLQELAAVIDWPDNAWIGVSVESKDYEQRIDCLRHVPAAIRFVSMEPLLGPLDTVDLSSIDWVIVGGESGPGARAMEEQWVLGIQKACSASNIPFFFKQWGGVNKKKTGRLLQGRLWDDMPDMRDRALRNVPVQAIRRATA